MGMGIGKPWYALGALWMVAGCGGPPPMPVLPAATMGEIEVAPVLPIDPRRQSYLEKDGVPTYLIGPGDVLDLTLRDVALEKETVTVRPDGNISFSLVENLQAAGLTLSELDEALTRALGRFLRDPKIDVEVKEYRSKMVSLLGAIQTATAAAAKSGQGRYALKTRTRMLDLILEAGGSTTDAQLDKVQLIRDGRAYIFNLQRALSTGDQSHNPILQGDDILIVPGTTQLTKKIVVLGEVGAPNVYLVPSDASLLEGLSRAGGLSTAALRDDIRVIRGSEKGPEMFTVNFERITRYGDLSQNVALQNNDIVYVPRSFMGDVNDVIAKIEPLLSVLLLPASYRDLYTTGGGLRVDTGEPPTTGTTGVFTRPLPGTTPAATTTAGAKPAVQGEGEEEKKEEK
jgi:protein involved in polysaccharide export with SLBB domain